MHVCILMRALGARDTVRIEEDRNFFCRYLELLHVVGELLCYFYACIHAKSLGARDAGSNRKEEFLLSLLELLHMAGEPLCCARRIYTHLPEVFRCETHAQDQSQEFLLRLFSAIYKMTIMTTGVCVRA